MRESTEACFKIQHLTEPLFSLKLKSFAKWRNLAEEIAISYYESRSFSLFARFF